MKRQVKGFYYWMLTEACESYPLSKPSGGGSEQEKAYVTAAKKVRATLVESGKFKLIKENDGCGNYEQSSWSATDGFYYYAPLEIVGNTATIINVNGMSDLQTWISEKKVVCYPYLKCGCSSLKPGKVLLDPNSDASTMIAAINAYEEEGRYSLSAYEKIK